MNINKSDFMAVIAHALAVGITSNPQQLNPNVSNADVGRLIHNRAQGITDGFFAAMEEANEDGD